MRPLREISTYADFDQLPVGTIVCVPEKPASGSIKNSYGTWDRFGWPDTRDADQAWLALSAPRGIVWVLWDPVIGPLAPKAWQTIIPSRSPRKKAHTSLGHAKNAISYPMYGGVARDDMTLLELNPVTGEFDVLFSIPKGTLDAQLPWRS